MNAHDRRVDHLNIAVVGLGDGVHEPIPMASLAPAVEAIVAGRVGAVALRQIAFDPTFQQERVEALILPCGLGKLS